MIILKKLLNEKILPLSYKIFELNIKSFVECKKYRFPKACLKFLLINGLSSVYHLNR